MKKLFYEDVYLKEWHSKVVDTYEKDGKSYIVLEETAFYPEGGGQPSDMGEINGIRVIDVVEEDNTIFHILESKPNETFKNIEVPCRLDFERRFDLMQQHTGQHLFSAIFFNKYKGETSSFHLGDDYISVDISISDISPEVLTDVENIANDYIFKNLILKTHVTKGEDIHKFPLRKLPPTTEDIRIVEIDSIDFSPCCGTHVSRTGEIGIIKIIKTEKYKGATRIYLKCGKRALKDYQNKTEIVLGLGKHLSVPENEVLMKVKAEGNEVKELSKQLNDLRNVALDYEARDLLSSSDSNLIISVSDSKSFNDIQTLSRQILDKGSYITILATSVDNKVLVAHPGAYDIDFGKLLKEHLSTYNGKGGGSSKQAQAAFQDHESMMKFIEFVKTNIKS